MKSDYGWMCCDGGNGSNSSGFSGLPGGYRGDNFSAAGYYGNWWSSSPNGSSAWYRYLFDFSIGAFRDDNYLRGGMSIRCLQDSE